MTSRHNISPIEVKSGSNYTISSLNKFRRKYKEQMHTAYVIHKNDLRTEEKIDFACRMRYCIIQIIQWEGETDDHALRYRRDPPGDEYR